MGENMKMKAEAGDDYDMLGQTDSMMVNLDEKYLKDTVIISNSDGSKTVKLEMDSEAFKAAFKELVDSTGESAAEGAEVKDISISNAVVEITVGKNGYIDTYKVKFDMDMKMDVMGTAYNVTVKLDASIKYNNPGKDVTVTAPAGYKNYPEVDPDALG
jgi:LEA14-like dessication related protein